MNRARWHMQFRYDARGYGTLRFVDGDIEWEGCCRTGSIDKTGALVNAIPPGEWLIRARTVPTTEAAMWIAEPGRGWKVRLHRKAGDNWESSRFLIHPDGGKPGTAGCIGIQGSDAPELRDIIDQVLNEQATISVYVSRDADYAK